MERRKAWVLCILCLMIVSGFAFRASQLSTLYLSQAQGDAPAISDWQFYTDTFDTDPAPMCARGISAGGFVLGADAACNVGGGETATALLSIPPADAERVLLLQILCPGGGGCANFLFATGEGEVSLRVDGQLLWHVTCDVGSVCNSLAMTSPPSLTIVTRPPSQHRLTLTATPNVSLAVERFDVSWQPVPEQIRGIAYSPFRDCQNPHFGVTPTAADIHEDMALLRHMGNAIRTYSSTGVQGEIPSIARQYGLRVSAGAALGPEHSPADAARNQAEIDAVIALSRTVDLESIIVGNEVLLRGDLTEAQLLAYIDQVREVVDVPVTTAATTGEYFDHRELFNHIDYVLVHIYSFWQNQPIENGAQFVTDQFYAVQGIAGGKPVVIGETGWPSGGSPQGVSVPSPENQRRFVREFLTLTKQQDIGFYYFAGFNELWKTEAGVGPFWGILDAERNTKYDLQSVLLSYNDQPQPRSPGPAIPAPTAVPLGESIRRVFPVYTNYAVLVEHDEHQSINNHFAPSGFMGDWHALAVDTCALDEVNPVWSERVTSITYNPGAADPGGWTGVYWQHPENNWATDPEGGYDLSEFAQVRFRARADIENARVKFMVGGVTGEPDETSTVLDTDSGSGAYGSSLRYPIYAQGADSDGFLTLTTRWQDYHIDLQGMDLSNVIDGFGWVGEREFTPDGVTVYLDNIVYDTDPPPLSTVFPIYNARAFMPGFDMGIDTSEHVYGWVVDEGGAFRMSYPPGQDWGAVFLTVGSPVPPGQRSSRDFSSYTTLAVDLRGEAGDEVVYIGIKDAQDPDDGSEIKIPVRLTTEWETYTFPLSVFTTADLAHIYVPIEFVFESDSPPVTVHFRNIRYLRGL